MANEFDQIDIFNYQAPSPEEILQAGSPPQSIIEPTLPTPIKDYFLYDVLNPQGRQLLGFVEQELTNPLTYLGMGAPAKTARGIQAIREKVIRESEDFADLRDLVSIEKNLKDPYFQKEIPNHPAVVRAQEKLINQPPTNAYENYGTETFEQNRKFKFGDQEVVGYDNALENLYIQSKQLAWVDDGLPYGGRPKVEGEAKRAVIVLGPPASGKSSIANPIARKINATIIDPDEAKKILPEYKGGMGAAATHRESKDITERVREIAATKGDNVVIPTVGDETDKIEDMINYWQSKGYEVDLVDVIVPAQEARTRMLKRFANTGRLIPFEYIDEVGDLPTQTYDIIKSKDLADGYTRIDNSVGINELKPVREDTRGLAEGIEGLQLEEMVPQTRRYGGAISQDSASPSKYTTSIGQSKRSLNIFSPLQGNRKLI